MDNTSMLGPTVVADIGGGTMKVGFVGDEDPRIIDNCIFKSKTLAGRTFIGSQIEDCNNLSSLYSIMPFKRGYVNNWDIQMQILEHTFKNLFKGREYSASGCNFIVMEPYFNFSSTKDTMNEVYFEDFQVASLLRANPAFFAGHKYQIQSSQRISRYCLIIDSGYSFTHIVPMCDGLVMKAFVLRLPVGGKILTNRLIETISYRYLDVRSEVYIMNQCKEDVCYVSTNFWKDLETTRSDPKRNPIMREYVLPDFVDVHRGYVRDDNSSTKQSSVDTPVSAVSRQRQPGYVLRLNNERFTVPELLFHPSDVGFSQMGITEAIDYLLCKRLPAAVRPGAWANMLAIGGCARFPGFFERLDNDIRCLAPVDLPVNLFKPDSPQTYAWHGACLFAQQSHNVEKFMVTRAEYEEHGSYYCERRFPVT